MSELETGTLDVSEAAVCFDPVLCLAGDLVGLFPVGRFSVCLRPEAAVCLTLFSASFTVFNTVF